MRKEFADVLAGFAKLLKIMLWSKTREIVALALKLGDRLTFSNTLGHGLKSFFSGRLALLLVLLASIG